VMSNIVIDSHIHSILLLTASFGQAKKGSVKPLSIAEWAKIGSWLHQHSLDPSALLDNDLEETLTGWSDKKITIERMKILLARGVSLAISLEKWQRTGLWIITKRDEEYPRRFREKLKSKCPPILFGYGEKKLLNHPRGIAIVGARNASETELEFANELGSKTAQDGFTVVSGGARGIDQQAMSGAIKSEGTVVGILADNLLKASTKSEYRDALLSKDMALISPYNPEAPFHVGNAMGRNRYIYCMSDAAVVVSSTHGKGGTWNGATEVLKNGWTPLWVKQTKDPDSGNEKLVAQGGNALPIEPFQVKELAEVDGMKVKKPELLNTALATDVGDKAVPIGKSRKNQIELFGDPPQDNSKNIKND